MASADESDVRYPGLYLGEVVDNADPEGLGRVRVRVPGLVEPASAWAFPLGTVGGGSDRRGFFVVPEKGAEVGVLFHQGDVDHPHYLCGHWGKPDGQAEVPEPVRGLPKDQVPLVRAFETPRFLLVFDDRSGSEKVAIRDKVTGDQIVLDPAAGISVKSAAKVAVEAPEVAIRADSSVTVDAPSVAIAGGGPAAARANDPVSVSPAFAAWIAAVTAVCNGIAPGSVTPPTGPIGQVAAGSTKVTIG